MNISGRLQRLEDEARARQPKPPVDYQAYIDTAAGMERLGEEAREALFRFSKAQAAGKEPEPRDAAIVQGLDLAFLDDAPDG